MEGRLIIKKIGLLVGFFICVNILISGIFKLKDISIVTMALETQDKESIIMYYDNGLEGYPFDDQHMIQLESQGSNRVEKIRYIIPTKSTDKLRIDLGNSPSTYKIYYISLMKTPFIKEVFYPKDILENFNQTNYIEDYYLNNDNVVIKTNGPDGFIYGNNITSKTQINRKIIILEIVLFILLAGITFSKALINRTNLKNKKMYSSIKLLHNKIIKFSCIAFIASIIFETIILKILALLTQGLYPDTLIARYFKPGLEWSGSRLYFWMIIFQVIAICYSLGKEKAFKYRYVIASIVLILLIIGKFHGSSMGCYDIMLNGNTSEYTKTTLLGNPQFIRGDEWATEKPYYMAQVKAGFPYFNGNLAFEGADMVVSAFAPVKNIISLAKPDILGFMFLGETYGFSFYWCVRLILLFMSTLEFMYLLTKRKKYALIGAIVIIFSPPIQWWLSQTLMFMILVAQYAIVLYCKYLTSTKKWIKYSSLGGVAWCALIYIMTVYPAFQVPLFYLMLPILIYFIYEYRMHKPFALYRIKEYLIVCVPIILILINFFVKSGPAMNILLNTVYPGKSRAWTPLPYDYHFYSLVNIFTSIKHPDFFNASEISSFWILMPFSIIVCILLFIKTEKKAKLPFIIGVTSCILFGYALLPEVSMLNKLTLMHYSYPVRINLIAGLGFTYMILAMLPYAERLDTCLINKKLATAFSITIFLILIMVSLKSNNINEYFTQMNGGKILLILSCCYICILGFLMMTINKKKVNWFINCFILLVVGSTILVNPLAQGTDSMFEKTTMSEIRRLDKEDPGRWMVSGNSTIANLVTAQGVSRTTGTYYYPDLVMMKQIDPEEKYFDLYNSFAHIDMRLTTGAVEMSKNGAALDIAIPIDVAKRLEIKYIFTCIDIPEEIISQGLVKLVYKDRSDDWEIYKVAY